MRNRILALVTLGLLAAALVGCSGDKGDDGITRKEFLAQAEKVCLATRKEIKAAAASMDPNDPAALSKFIVQTSTEVLNEIEDLRDIGFPKGDDQVLDKALSVYEDKFTQWQSDPTAAAVGADDKELLAAGKQLAEYGLPACGASVSDTSGGDTGGGGKGKGD